MKGHNIEAIFYLQQTVKMAPDHLQAHEQLARLLPQQRREGEAGEHARQAVYLKPQQKVFYKETPVWMAPDYRGLLH
jgi:Flp pilus assembly protein TadD